MGGNLYYETVSIGSYKTQSFPIGVIETTLPQGAFGGLLVGDIVHVHVHVHVRVRVHLLAYVNVCMRVYVCMRLCVYVHVCVCFL